MQLYICFKHGVPAFVRKLTQCMSDIGWPAEEARVRVTVVENPAGAHPWVDGPGQRAQTHHRETQRKCDNRPCVDSHAFQSNSVNMFSMNNSQLFRRCREGELGESQRASLDRSLQPPRMTMPPPLTPTAPSTLQQNFPQPLHDQ